MPHFVKIEMGTTKGWWTTSENATLTDPDSYAMKVFAQTDWCQGVRITDHDSGEVWSSGGRDVPENALGFGHPSLPSEQQVNPDFADLLGEPETILGVVDPPPAAGFDDLLGEPEKDSAASASWDDLL